MTDDQMTELKRLRARVAELARRLMAAEDDLMAAQQVGIDALAKLDNVREIATNWSDGDCAPVQRYGDEILEALGEAP